MSRPIFLSNGLAALVDTEGYAWLSVYSWYEANSYAQTKEPGTNKNLYMHRLIMGAASGELVHHGNEDTLDNWRYNLKLLADNADHARYHRMHDGWRKRNHNGYRGVSCDTGAGKWRAQIHPSGQAKRHLGYFETSEQAARIYDLAARAAWPEGCHLNFPNSYMWNQYHRDLGSESGSSAE
jgi:hypothetical protein